MMQLTLVFSLMTNLNHFLVLSLPSRRAMQLVNARFGCEYYISFSHIIPILYAGFKGSTRTEGVFSCGKLRLRFME